MILFVVGGYRLAIPARAVEEIRSLEGLVPIPQTKRYRQPRVCSALERQGKTYWVVDGSIHFRVTPAAATRIIILREHQAALLVESIDRMSEIVPVRPLPKAFQGEERRWFRGLSLLNEEVIPVVNPEVILSRADAAIAAAQLRQAVEAMASA